MKIEDYHTGNAILDDMNISSDYEVVKRDGGLYLQCERRSRLHATWEYAVMFLLHGKRCVLWDYRVLIATNNQPRVKAMDVAGVRRQLRGKRQTHAMQFLNDMVDVFVDFLGP